MLNYYYKNDGVRIKIARRPSLSTLIDIFKHIDFKTPTSRLEVGSVSTSSAKHLFGYFFLNSFLRIKLTSGESRYASFNFGPLINLGSGRIEVGSGSTRSSLRRFSQSLGDRFALLYEKQYMKKGDKQEADEFIKIQSVLCKELREGIVTKINNLYNDEIITEKEKRFLTDKLLRNLRKDVLNRVPELSIRAQVEEFLSDSHSYITEIIFEGIPDPDPNIDGDFRIKLNIEQILNLEGFSITTFPSSYKYLSLVRRAYLMSQSQNVANEIKEIILSQEVMDATGGKVRFYPLMDIDEGVGNQFLLTIHEGGDFSYLPYGRFYGLDQYDGGYFEVDFSNPSSDDIHILKHIALLMYTGKISFVMTKADDNVVSIERAFGDQTRTIFIHEMICAFNREGFLYPEDILSEPVPDPSDTYVHSGEVYQIVFSGDFTYSVPSHDFESHHLFDENAIENQLIFTIDGFGFTDMRWYIDKILAGSLVGSNKIRDTLGI
jgi:hypothetical protein